MKGFERIVRIIGSMTEKQDQKQSIILTNAEDLREKIYIIRGVKVMLDRDLAKIYGYETRYLNLQVKRNLNKFQGEDFMFQLTRQEWENLMLHFATSDSLVLHNKNGGTRKLPFAFTEQGIYMLMTVLKGELATKQSRLLIRLFKQMKDILISESPTEVNQHLLKLHERVDGIESQMVTKSALQDFMINFTDEHLGRELLIFNGQTLEASVAHQEIFERAHTSIMIIDNYLSLKTLLYLKNINSSIQVTIYSDNTGQHLTQKECQTFCQEHPKLQLKFQRTHGLIHDRFIIIDYDTPNEKAYHCGSSLKDTGKRITMIMQVADVSLLHGVVAKLNSS